MSDNPLLQDFTLPHGAIPFDKIEESHYLPAVKEAIEEARQNIEAIKNNPDSPNFENTIVALETASERLGMAAGIFYNQLHAAGTDGLEALAQDIGPLNANFSSDVAMDEMIFKRVRQVYDARDELGLNTEQHTLLDDTYKGFVRGGALLNDTDKKRFGRSTKNFLFLGPTSITMPRNRPKNF